MVLVFVSFFRMVLDGFNWFEMVLDDFRWFQMFLGFPPFLSYTTTLVVDAAEVDMDVREALASAPKQR